MQNEKKLLKLKLITLEKSLLTFEVRGSEDKLKQLIAPDFKEIGASGAYFGLEEVLERLPTEQNWTASVQNFEFKELSQGICQLVFKAFIKSNDGDEGTYSLRSSIWKEYDDGWKVIFHQGTKVAPFDIAF